MDKDKLYRDLELFKGGEESSFESIYIATNNMLYNYIFSLSDSLNNEDCIELVQETFIQVYKKIDTLNENKAFISWLVTIARNKSLRYLEKNKKEVLLSEDGQGIFEQEVETDGELLPEGLIDSNEKKKLVLDIIESLPKDQKEVIYLRYYNGLSVKQIAEYLSIADGTVKSRLNYGRKKIQSEVEALEKKGTKLYGITGLPILLLFLREAMGASGISKVQEQNLLSNIVNSAHSSGVNNSDSNMENSDYLNTENNSTFNNENQSNYNEESQSDYNNEYVGNYNEESQNIYNEENQNDYSDKMNNNGENTKNCDSKIDFEKETIDKTSTGNKYERGAKRASDGLFGAGAVKGAIVALLSMAIIGGGAYLYISSNDDSTKSTVSDGANIKDDGEKEVADEDSTSKNNTDSNRFEINSYETKVEKIYNIVKNNNLFGEDTENWNIDYMISEMVIITDGYGEQHYDYVKPMWASQWIESFLTDIEILTDSKAEIGKEDSYNDKEKETIKKCNEMIDYFLANQGKLNNLNEKLKEVAGFGDSFGAVDYATKFNKDFENYKELVEKLK